MSLFTFDLNSASPRCQCDASELKIGVPTVDLFDATARRVAEELAEPQVLLEDWKTKQWRVKREDKANKPTQVRRFYDELCMWDQKVRDLDSFGRLLPFIKMMNAKVAYARGRDLVDDKFVTWFSTCMEQIREPNETGLAAFRNFRTHYEAFLGFFKQARPN
ncbi:type III-A CRISPR-associated protein Csm2 [Methylolobus aquaticus]